MIRFLRIPQCITALALVALPVAASAQSGPQLTGASSLGLTSRVWLVVGNDSTEYQKVEITWESPVSKTSAPRQTSTAQSADGVRTGAASIKFMRAVSAESQKVRTWLQHGNTLEPVHVTLVDTHGKVLSMMKAPSFTAEKWSINSMDAGASAVSIETLVVSTPALRVQGTGFGG